MSIYDDLGLSPLINAAGTYTIVGGSKMSEQTLNAMSEAARNHVEIGKLQQVVQERIASLTNNESSAICNGADAGIYLSAVSAIAKMYDKKTRYLSIEEITKAEILSMSAQHIPYDYVIRQLGAKQVWAGYPNIPDSMSSEDLEACITKNTAAIFYFISSPYGLDTPGALSLEETIVVGNKYNLPVIVDAAAQLPPRENLWKFTQMGATVAIFSGGKYLRGPQSSGLIVGKSDFMDIVHETNFPNYGFGRMLKTGREEIIGLYSAIEQYMEIDPAEEDKRAEDMVQKIISALSKSELFSVERVFPNEAGQPMAFVRVTVNGDLDLSEIAQEMRSGDSPIFIKPEGKFFYINPMTIYDDELPFVIKKFQEFEANYIKSFR